MSEPAGMKCKCGRPAVDREYEWEPPRCFICQLVSRHASGPPRKGPGNVGDYDIAMWMERKLRAAFEDMLFRMRSDLDALSKKWNPPVEQSDKPK
jgi:hypothetical protein